MKLFNKLINKIGGKPHHYLAVRRNFSTSRHTSPTNAPCIGDDEVIIIWKVKHSIFVPYFMKGVVPKITNASVFDHSYMSKRGTLEANYHRITNSLTNRLGVKHYLFTLISKCRTL